MLSIELEHLRVRAHRQLLTADRPLPTPWIARALFGARRHERPETQLVVKQLLRQDDRFLEMPDGRWSAASAPHARGLLAEVSYAIVDLETTGSIVGVDEIIEVGLVLVRPGRPSRTFASLVHSRRPVPGWVANLTGIHGSDLQDAPRLEDVFQKLNPYLEGAVFVAHDVRFDLPFLSWELSRRGLAAPEGPCLCTLQLARTLWPQLRACGLAELARHFRLEHRQPHHALADARVTTRILLRALQDAQHHGCRRLADLYRLRPATPAGERSAELRAARATPS
jgi:DNA polymerase III epsilon subunit family exonuclease